MPMPIHGKDSDSEYSNIKYHFSEEFIRIFGHAELNYPETLQILEGTYDKICPKKHIYTDEFINEMTDKAILNSTSTCSHTTVTSIVNNNKNINILSKNKFEILNSLDDSDSSSSSSSSSLSSSSSSPVGN